MSSSSDEALSERLAGICTAASLRIAQLLAIHLHERLTPAAIDELRSAVELAVRAAAFEGARCHHNIAASLNEGRLSEPILTKETRAVNVPKKPPKGAF